MAAAQKGQVVALNRWEPTPEEIEEVMRQLAELHETYGIKGVFRKSELSYTPPPLLIPSPIVPAPSPIVPAKTLEAWEILGISRETYDEMGFLHNGQRIGITEKEEYYRKLADAYAEGYLPKEIFEYRQQFIDNAETQTQCETVLKDLQNLGKAVQAQQLDRNDTSLFLPKKTTCIMAITGMLLMLAIAIYTGIHGQYVGILFLLLATAFAVVAGKAATRKGHGE